MEFLLSGNLEEETILIWKKGSLELNTKNYTTNKKNEKEKVDSRCCVVYVVCVGNELYKKCIKNQKQGQNIILSEAHA